MGIMTSKIGLPIYNKVQLLDIAKTHSLRCDAKQFETRFAEIIKILSSDDSFFLGELLPHPLIKGGQPSYIDGADGVPVINTLSIQLLSININIA